MTGIYYTPSHVFEPCEIYDTCSNVGDFLERIMTITLIIKNEDEVETQRETFDTLGFDYMNFIATLNAYLDCKKRRRYSCTDRHLKELIETLEDVQL